jgi:hypothetical protein
MRKFAVPVSLFLTGTVIGFIVASNIFHWIASALGRPILSSNLKGFTSRIQFAAGCGILFATAAIAGRSLPWIAVYLSAGILVSAAVALLTHSTYAWYRKDAESLGLNVAMSMQALPTFRIPLIGAVGILLLVFLRWIRSGRTRVAPSPK